MAEVQPSNEATIPMLGGEPFCTTYQLTCAHKELSLVSLSLSRVSNNYCCIRIIAGVYNNTY